MRDKSTMRIEGSKVLCAILLTLTLAGCSSAPPADVRRPIIERAKSIGVVLAAGKQASIRYTGITVFENWARIEDISAWGLDGKINDAILAAMPRRLNVEFSEYAKDLERIHYLPANERGFRSDLDERTFGPYLASLHQRKPVDLLLLILPGQYPPLALQNRTPYAGNDLVTAALEYVLVDASTRKEVFGVSSWKFGGRGCGQFKFDYWSSNRKEEFERSREPLQQIWLDCVGRDFKRFLLESGLN
jgi:hypothetical protein